MSEKRCVGPGCPKVFEPRKAWAKFCSVACKNAYNNARRAEGLRLLDAALAAPLALAAGLSSTGLST